jgi:2-(1,2-epoxy-1,2-dihydrophenyl)acetyl-CoA isomerase
MLADMDDAIVELQNPEHNIRCLLITGAGRGFCAGADLSPKDKAGDSKIEGSGKRTLDNTFNPFFMRLRHLEMPIITAVRGPAAGVGMSLALMGDLVLAGRSAYFLQAFRRVGLIPDGGSTYLLPRRIGMARAMELSILGEKLPAEKALEWGLINLVYEDDDLMAEAMNLAMKLAAGPTVSLRLIRKAYWESVDNTYEQQLHLESRLQVLAGATQDHKEGVKAFQEKREARFKGD